MQREEALIRCARGAEVPGYICLGSGRNHDGAYREVLTPEGTVERVYLLDASETRHLLGEDRYNRLHTYRRPGDEIALFADLRRRTFIVLAVKEGDDLSQPPFGFLEGPVVFLPPLPRLAPGQERGLVLLTQEALRDLVSRGALTKTESEIFWLQHRNVGFQIAKEGPPLA